MTKQRISTIIDTSSYGLTVGDLEVEISRESLHRLKKLCKHSDWLQGVITENTISTIFLRKPVNGNSNNENTYVTYIIKMTSNKKIFLNATGNPTTLMAGRNDLPVLLNDEVYAHNAPLNTFKYANRLLFAILEFVPVREGYDSFVWPKADRERWQRGEINVSQMQIAWYSGDLGRHRNDLLKIIRSCYVGLKTNTGRNLAQDLGIKATAWDGEDNYNVTLECMSSAHKEISVTLYAKDEQLRQKGIGTKKELSRLNQLIRFDCTLRNFFLIRRGMKTVREIEEKYVELCDQFGYDQGFVRWLSDYVQDRLNLKYFLHLQHHEYISSLMIMREMSEGTDVAAKLADFWFYDKRKSTQTRRDIAKILNFHENGYQTARDKILTKTGIDIDIPRSYHNQILSNRCDLIMTKEEYEAARIDYTTNDVLSLRQQAKRSDEFAKEVSSSLNNAGALKIRRLSPRKVKSSNFYIRKLFRGEVS